MYRLYLKVLQEKKRKKTQRRPRIEATLYVCKKCEFKSDRKYNLKRHFKTTHDDKCAYTYCSRCPFFTKHEANMKIHEKKCIISFKKD